MRAPIACSALAAILLLFANPVLAQPAAARDGEAHILSAFASRADPGVLGDNVRLGPALRSEFGADADSRRIYAALIERVADKPLRVRLLAPEEAARHASLVGSLAEPLLVLEAGDAAFLMQYATKEKDVVFVEQLRGPQVELPPQAPPPAAITAVPLAAEPAPAAAPAVAPAAIEKPKAQTVVEKPKPAPVVVQKPKPVPVVVQKKPAPAPATAETPRPRGECVVKPVMTDDDLRNCGARP